MQYPTTGGSCDWAKGAAGIKWVLLMELPDKGDRGFLLPAERIEPTARSVMAGFRAAAAKISHTLIR